MAWTLVVFVPLVVYDTLETVEAFTDPVMLRTAIAASIALLSGLFLVGRVLNLPGTRGTVHGVPIMLLAFGLAALVLFAFRIEYSRLFLLYSTITGTFFAMRLRWIDRDLVAQTFHVVPFGKANRMQEVAKFPTQMMTAPVIPEGPRVSIVADFRADLSDEWERLLASASLSGVPVYHYKQLLESITGQVKIEHLSENSFGSLIPNQSYTPIKRLIDVVGSIIAIVLTLPVMLALMLLIWLEDRQSPFFVQTRTGHGGRPFRMYKFRSMTSRPPARGAAARDDAITKDDDQRITRIGRVIRKIRFDELPQLFNVLKGEMSLIGPRPEANQLAEWYEEHLAFYSYRNIVKPGLTGWAQVNQGHVATLEDIDIKLQYDFYYIKYFSFWLDVLIVMRTIHTIVTGFGSK
ncbi:sugar transferase [Citromicrobium bathyomarinum]|uniref:sugar transferase n=1 Tax=Sphingomonadales TaxID=204457 RepID=UPI001A4B5B29|nr:sugar transferase [Citromicrobium sp.]